MFDLDEFEESVMFKNNLNSNNLNLKSQKSVKKHNFYNCYIFPFYFEIYLAIFIKYIKNGLINAVIVYVCILCNKEDNDHYLV